MSVNLSKVPTFNTGRKARKEALTNSLIQNMIGTNDYRHLLRNDLNALQSVMYWDYSER